MPTHITERTFPSSASTRAVVVLLLLAASRRAHLSRRTAIKAEGVEHAAILGTHSDGTSSVAAASAEFSLDPGGVSAILALVGLGLYGLTYTEALTFYNRFGVTPEDVGWSNVRAIADSSFVLGIPTVVAALTLAVLLKLLGMRVQRPRGRSRWVRWISLLLILAGIAGLRLLSVVPQLQDAATQVLQVGAGDTTYPIESGVTLASGVGAWIEADAGGSSKSIRTTVVLLGQANGTSVLYDVCLKQVVRLPTGLLVFTQDDDLSQRGVPLTSQQQEAARARYCASVGRQLR